MFGKKDDDKDKRIKELEDRVTWLEQRCQEFDSVIGRLTRKTGVHYQSESERQFLEQKAELMRGDG